MTRKPDDAGARALAGQGATIVYGDLDDPASLERALKGAWGALAVQDSWEAGVAREEAQGKRVVELARLAGVQHFVYQSVASAHRSTGVPHFDNKRRVEETVGIRPDTRLQMIAVADIGHYGRLSFERYEALNGRALDIAGDDLTTPEVARVLSAVTGRMIGFRHVPIEEVRKASGDFARMLEWFDTVGYTADIKGLEAEFGIRPTSLREWASAQKWC